MTTHLTAPLSNAEATILADHNGTVDVSIDLSMDDLVDNSFEEFLDLLERAVLRTGILGNISYTATSVEADGSIRVQVIGDLMLDEDEDTPSVEI